MPNTIQVVRFQIIQIIQTICIPKAIQLVRLQAIQIIQTIQALYHTLVEREVFSVKSALGINIFWVKKRIIGFRHSLFFGYQVGSLGGSSGGLIAFLPYGFDTDLLINLWKNDDLDKRHFSTDYIIKRSSGFVIGVNIGASTWLSPDNNTIFTTTIFQFQGKFGVRWNRDKYNAGRYLGGSSIELGVKVPAFSVSDNFLRRWVSVYFNYTYNFKNKH